MANFHLPYSSAPTREVKEIQFGLFSQEESERLAVINIEYPETMYVDFTFYLISSKSNVTDSNLQTGMSSASDLVRKVRTILISEPSIATSDVPRVKRT
jgi:hypothetical protein